MPLIKKIILLIGDIGVLYLSLLLTMVVRYGAPSLIEHFATHLIPFSFIFIAWIFIFFLSDFYRIPALRTKRLVFKKLATMIPIAIGVSTVLFYLFTGFFELTPKTNLFLLGIIFFLFVYLWRMIASHLFSAGASNLLIIGNSITLHDITRHITHHPYLGYRIGEKIENSSLLTYENIRAIIADKKITLVVVQPEFIKDPSIRHTLYTLLLEQEITTVLSSNFYELIFEKIPLQDIREDWFLEYVTAQRTVYDFAKRSVDILLSILLAVILFLPLCAVLCIARITSRERVWYIQERMGKNGKIFKLYKLRTMREGAQGALWTEQNDTRITKIGKLLRATHCDEIPQLWNIIRGDISFVGPRPERKELAEEFRTLPFYEMRHIIKPGLTGWAQINFRPSASREEAFEKLQYDIFYIKNRSFVLDSMIILKTIRHLFISS